MSMVFATAAVRADLANYQTDVAGQSPAYYNTLDDKLVPTIDTVGGGTLTASAGASFGSDFFGNASNAAFYLGASGGNYNVGSANIISGAGSSSAVGTLSFLFKTGSAIPSTGYFFSAGETIGAAAGGQPANSAFALQFSSGALSLDLGGKRTILLASGATAANTWYYFAVTYNFNGTTAGDTGTWYLGAAGGTLSSGTAVAQTVATSTVGDGSSFVLGNRQASPAVFGGTGAGGASSGSYEADELATWNTALPSDQISSQYNTLTVAAVPEPSTCTMFGLGGLLVLWKRRTSRHDFSRK